MTYQTAFGICIATREGQYEDIPWELHDLGAEAVETRDRTTMSAPEAADTVLFIGAFADESRRNEAANTLLAQYPELEMTRTEIRDDGWSEGWKKFFEPVVLERLQVITPWMETPAGGRETIVIDPGQAFGTGGHATTRLMLQLIEQQSRQGFPDSVLDVGTGSGVLAIACAKLGAPHILGFDVEDTSVEAAIENALRNGVGEQIEVVEGSPEHMTGAWALVLANIQLAVFLLHAGAISSLVQPGGILMISGILEEQREQCLSLWPEFTLLEMRQEGEWLAMSLEKRS